MCGGFDFYAACDMYVLACHVPMSEVQMFDMIVALQAAPVRIDERCMHAPAHVFHIVSHKAHYK
jgi:hypothetical protein